MTQRLDNKIALVTGGTTGIGFATARRLAAEGATVIVTGRNPETLEIARRELGQRAEVIASDASDDQAIQRLINSVGDKHGRIDVLFLNAGMAKFAPLTDAPVEDFDRMWNLNVRGPWLAIKHAAKFLSEGASIVVNTSIVNQRGFAGASAYAATKAALRSIVRTAAVEFAEKKIRINAVSPGPIETPIYGKLGMPQADLDGFAETMTSQVPLARFGAADEVAGTVAFLASSDASYVNGVEIPVDGGFASV